MARRLRALPAKMWAWPTAVRWRSAWRHIQACHFGYAGVYGASDACGGVPFAAPKSNALYKAYETAKKDALEMLDEQVPLVIRNAHDERAAHYGECQCRRTGQADQDIGYLPDSLQEPALLCAHGQGAAKPLAEAAGTDPEAWRFLSPGRLAAPFVSSAGRSLDRRAYPASGCRI